MIIIIIRSLVLQQTMDRKAKVKQRNKDDSARDIHRITTRQQQENFRIEDMHPTVEWEQTGHPVKKHSLPTKRHSRKSLPQIHPFFTRAGKFKVLLIATQHDCTSHTKQSNRQRGLLHPRYAKLAKGEKRLKHGRKSIFSES